MNRSIAVLAAIMVVTAAGVPTLAAAGAGAAPTPSVDGNDVEAQDSPNNNTTSENDTESVSPGAELAGVIGVQGTELKGEVENRAFGQAMANAKSNSSKAAVVANQAENLNQRLETLRERKQELRESWKNGTITTGQYKAQMAQLAAEIRTVSRLANSTETHAEGLPAETLREHGVNVTAIQQLKKNASEMSGPEVAAIARTIGGGPPENVTRGPPDNRTTGPGNDHGNGQGPPANTTTGPNNGQGQANVTTGAGNGQGNANVTTGAGNGQGNANVTTGVGNSQNESATNRTTNASDPGNDQGHGPDDNPGNNSSGGNESFPLDVLSMLAKFTANIH